jgi:hypothetical protein
MSNLKVIPFSELLEKVSDLSRSNTDQKSRIKGIVNEVYTLDIPKEYDWYWLKANSAISCIAEYKSGTVAINTQDTAIYFGSGAVITTDMTGRKIKFYNNSDIYDFTYVAANSGSILPPLSGSTNIISGGYTIYKNIYSLPSDFDRFPVNGGLLFYSAGQPSPLPELVDDDYYEQVNTSPTSIPEGCRFTEYDTAGNMQIEIIPPPSVAYILRDEYIKTLAPMLETTMGTIVINSNQTAVTGTGTLFLEMNTGDYLRADRFGTKGESIWYKISAISSNSDLTLTNTFRRDSSYTGTFTISAEPKIPYKFHNGIIYGAIRKILSDEKDPMLMYANAEYLKIINDNKVLEQSRHAKDDVELIAEDFNYRR